MGRWMAVFGLVAALGNLLAQEASVKPGINDQFRKPDVKAFVERFEGESREIFEKREAISKASGVKPGMVVADIGAGTGLFTRIFSRVLASSARPLRACVRSGWPCPALPAAMTLNLPNILTLSRVPLMFIVVGLMYAQFRWAATTAFWLYIVAALTDWLDGKIARERGEVSSFGRFMDAVIDKVMVIGLMIALVVGDYFMGYEVFAMLLLLCILGREFAISGMRMAAVTQPRIPPG